MKHNTRFRRALTPANVLATTALVLSLGGTSFAAVTLTGANVKNETLTGVDVKNRSLTRLDLSAATITQLRGLTGPKGDKGLIGLQGDRGDTGAPGINGKDGAPAQLVSSYAQERPGSDNFLNAGFDRYVSPSGATPNGPTPGPWYQYDNVTEGADLDPADSIDGRYTQPELDGTLLTSGTTNLISLTDGQANGGQLNVNFNNYVSGNASITLLHRGAVHSRAECQLYVSDGLTLTAIGEQVWVSSDTDYEMVTVGLVGTKDFTAAPASPKQYNVIVRCRDGDRTPTPQWEYVRGNLTAFAASR